MFHWFFRKTPKFAPYCVAAGMQQVCEYISTLDFTEIDLAYLATLSGNDGKPLFEPAFLDYLATLTMTVDVDAVPEGTLVFPNEPLLRIRGPLLQCQLLETALLTLVNFPTLIATKAARVCQAAGEAPVLEFGLRRAQGIDGGISASRAAYIGGCVATSNVLAGRLFGIPVKGTHAHSWIMSFDSELEAFRTYAAAMPNNCIFLVDTYDTLRGVDKAIQVGRWLHEQGHEMVGVRLDSGDLAQLSQAARSKLDAAGFKQAKIVASNDLDEHAIQQLHAAGAQIDIWGIGTKLSTSYDQPALGGVYKLAAIRDDANSAWQYRLKLSNEAIKVSNPGSLQIRRFYDTQGQMVADALFNTFQPPPSDTFTALEPHTQQVQALTGESEDLLQPLLRQGQAVAALPSLAMIRSHAQAQLAACAAHVGLNDLSKPYAVYLEQTLYELKNQLITELKSEQD